MFLCLTGISVHGCENARSGATAVTSASAAGMYEPAVMCLILCVIYLLLHGMARKTGQSEFNRKKHSHTLPSKAQFFSECSSFMAFVARRDEAAPGLNPQLRQFLFFKLHLGQTRYFKRASSLELSVSSPKGRCIAVTLR